VASPFLGSMRGRTEWYRSLCSGAVLHKVGSRLGIPSAGLPGRRQVDRPSGHEGERLSAEEFVSFDRQGVTVLAQAGRPARLLAEPASEH
jgi:hypothetical protein